LISSNRTAFNFSDTELFEKNWGYDLIERYGAGKVATAGLRIQVVPASAAVADLLAIAAQTPVLLLERVSRDEAGKPLECLRLFGVAGEYQLSLVLTKTEYQSAVLRGVRPVTKRPTHAAKSPKSRTTAR
jgi:DNA-binding GntR family transcriptional regulator